MHAEQSRASALWLRVTVQAADLQEILTLSLDQELVFGRDPECDVVLPSASVSRRHVVLLRERGVLCVRDQSSHGTRVDGELLHHQVRALTGPAQLSLGPYLLSLQVLERPLQLDDKAADAESQIRETPLEVRRKLRAELLESLDLVALDRSRMDPSVMRPKVREALERSAVGMGASCPSGAAREALLEELCDETLGLGPLEPLLSDPAVSEIMVVDPSTIYVERGGRIDLSERRFTDESAVRAVLERIVTPLGRRIDESSPIVDARLRDGSRVNAVIPPLALKGPALTIRKFPQTQLTLARLVELGTLNEAMARFLAHCVAARINVVIAGGTGSGKTTLLNVLSSAIPAGERIVTVEDAAELQLHQRHVVALETRPPNLEGEGAITIRDLVKNALRMRPDRIVVGECRGGEALDMLQAMNTGHEGSMTTTHANSPREAVQRLEMLCMMAGLDLPLYAIRRQLASSVGLLVQQARFADGARRVTHITEVVRLDEGGEVELRDVFRFVSRPGRAGEFLATGAIPQFVDKLIAAGPQGAGVWS